MSKVSLRRVVSNVVAKDTPGERPLINLDMVGVGTGNLFACAIGDAVAIGQCIAADKGDVLFAKLRPYLRKSLLINVPVFASGEFLCLRPSASIDSNWLRYVTLTDRWIYHAVASTYGSKMPRTSWEQMADLIFAVPPLDEQRRIAAFLDDQVARIDQAIALRERQMQTARERRWELFASRVREVPSRTLPLRRVLSFVTDGPFGSAFSSDDYVEDGYPVVRLGNIGFAQFRDTDLAKIPKGILDRFPRCRVFAGDLLVAALGDDRNHAGRACTAPPSIVPAMVKGKCFCVRTVPNLASSRFLSILLSSPLGAKTFSIVGRGSTRNMINIEILKESVWDLPQLADQELIVEQFEHESTKAWHLESAFVSAVKLLQERKRTLITAAVTGEFDVNSASTRSLAGVTS